MCTTATWSTSIADNAKLRRRATRIVAAVAGRSEEEAAAALAAAGGAVKPAVLIAAGAAGRAEAERVCSPKARGISARRFPGSEAVDAGSRPPRAPGLPPLMTRPVRRRPAIPRRLARTAGAPDSSRAFPD